MNYPQGPSDEDVERRFTELMSAEFSAPPVAASAEEGDPWDHPDDEDYRMVPEHPHSWSLMTTLGVLMLSGGLVGALVMLFGLNPGRPWPQIAVSASLMGAGLLMWRALNTPQEVDGDGSAL